MKTLILSTFFALIGCVLLTSCEERQRTIQQGELISCPILEKLTKGSNNPKGPKKRHYLKIHIEPSDEKRNIAVDTVTYNAVYVGDRVQGYYLDGVFVLKRGQL